SVLAGIFVCCNWRLFTFYHCTVRCPLGLGLAVVEAVALGAVALAVLVAPVDRGLGVARGVVGALAALGGLHHSRRQLRSETVLCFRLRRARYATLRAILMEWRMWEPAPVLDR